jgi:hypothetical protein
MKSLRTQKNVSGYIIPTLSAIFMLLLVGITIFSVRSGAKQFSGEAMVSDIALLAQLFEQIDEDCTILSFDTVKNTINFLTVGTFAGSEVGSMNLAHPEKWRGPYLKDNSAIQGIEYQIVRTDAGYFIVPGDGVTLPDGKTMGKDLQLDEKTDISALIGESGPLSFKGTPLAAKLTLGNSARKSRPVTYAAIPMIDDF